MDLDAAAPAPTRVLAGVVEFVPLLRRGVEAALADAGMDAAFLTASAREALRACVEDPPELVVAGRCSDLTLVQLATRLRGLSVPPRLVALVDGPGPEVPALLRAGATAVLSRSADAEDLASVATRVATGATVVAPGLVTALGDVHVTDALEGGLTRREREVLALLVEGRSNREIAAELFVGGETVKSHLRSVYAKLGVRDRRAAVRVAADRGLLHVT